MMRRTFSRGLVSRVPTGRIAPHVAGSPRFMPQRPIGIYARRLNRPKPPERPLFTFDSDGFFAFALMALILFAWTLGTVGAVAISAMALVYIMLRLPQLGEIMAPRAFILIIPFFAVISILWSQSPVDTLKYSLEFALTTVVALLFSAAPYPRRCCGAFSSPSRSIFPRRSFSVRRSMSAITVTGDVWPDAEQNLLGDMAATGALVSLACFMASIEDRRPFRAIAALAVAAAEIYVLLAARSAGALLGVVPAVFAFIFFLALRPARLTMRLIATVFASLAAAVMTIAYGSSLVEDSMTLFEKDLTLTGRTYLWQRAADFIAEKPALGAGFNAFWVQGNPDAEGMWRFAGITERMGFSFHNTLFEWLVNIGWVGVSLLTIVAIVSTILMVRRVMTRPTLALCFWLSILVYEFVRMRLEAIGMAPFAHPTISCSQASARPWPHGRPPRPTRRRAEWLTTGCVSRELPSSGASCSRAASPPDAYFPVPIQLPASRS